MDGSIEWDPHLNVSVPVWFSNYTGQLIRYFNPWHFPTDQLAISTLAGLPLGDVYVWVNAAPCVYPLSGCYCLLNRLLFFLELFFGLLTLALGYEWLSTVVIVAALNYSGAAACHAIALAFSPGDSVLDMDTVPLKEILSLSVFFANPLLQWSETLQKRDRVDARIVVALWSVLVCIATAITMYSPKNNSINLPYAPISFATNCFHQQEVEMQIFLSNTSWTNEALVRYPDLLDTIHPHLIFIGPRQWKDCQGAVIDSCALAKANRVSPLRTGQAVVPLPTSSNFEATNSFGRIGFVFSVYAVMTCAVTVEKTLHGHRNTHYIRARIYEALRSNSKRNWRRAIAFSAALLYYIIHFIISITSLPIAVGLVGVFEALLCTYPQGEATSSVGQWGPWNGAGLLLLAVVITKDPNPNILRSWIVWLSTTPFHLIWSRRVTQKTRRPINFSVHPQFLKTLAWSLQSFFSREFTSTKNWVLRPEQESKNCIRAELQEIAAHNVNEKNTFLMLQSTVPLLTTTREPRGEFRYIVLREMETVFHIDRRRKRSTRLSPKTGVSNTMLAHGRKLFPNRLRDQS